MWLKVVEHQSSRSQHMQWIQCDKYHHCSVIIMGFEPCRCYHNILSKTWSFSLQEVVLSSEQDPFFKSNMFENFGDLGANIKKMVDDFQSKSKNHQNIQSLGTPHVTCLQIRERKPEQRFAVFHQLLILIQSNLCRICAPLHKTRHSHWFSKNECLQWKCARKTWNFQSTLAWPHGSSSLLPAWACCSADDMVKFVENYPEYRKQQGGVSKHVTLMTEMSRIVDERLLMSVSQVEQELACSAGQPAAFEVLFQISCAKHHCG